jgi:hypothetical protein
MIVTRAGWAHERAAATYARARVGNACTLCAHNINYAGMDSFSDGGWELASRAFLLWAENRMSFQGFQLLSTFHPFSFPANGLDFRHAQKL